MAKDDFEACRKKRIDEEKASVPEAPGDDADSFSFDDEETEGEAIPREGVEERKRASEEGLARAKRDVAVDPKKKKKSCQEPARPRKTARVEKRTSLEKDKKKKRSQSRTPDRSKGPRSRSQEKVRLGRKPRIRDHGPTSEDEEPRRKKKRKIPSRSERGGPK